jgi:hypothetical protein
MVKSISDSGLHDERAFIQSELTEELSRIDRIRNTISRDSIPGSSYGILVVTILVNVLLFWHYRSVYLYLWVASSLYFYLFYPMLPLFLFPFRMVHQKISGEQPLPKNKGSMIEWAKNLQIFSHKRTGYQLFMRFFLYSMIPITYGVIGIYGISILFTLIIAYTTTFADETFLLILVQCLGIIAFYSEVFYFRGMGISQTHRMVKTRTAHHRRIVVAFAIAGSLIVISTILVFLMIIAMVMPAFTLTTFVNMIAFSYAGRNVSVIIVLFSQFIFMQYLQSILSRSFALDQITTLSNQLSNVQKMLNDEKIQISEQDVKKIETRILESRLYAYNRRNMLGLFPTYSVGVNIPVLLSIKSLGSLEEILIPRYQKEE